MYRSRIKDELDERYDDGKYAIVALVIILAMMFWAVFETRNLLIAIESYEASKEVNMCLLP